VKNSDIFPDICLSLYASNRIVHIRKEEKLCDYIFENADKIARTQKQIDVPGFAKLL